MADYDYPSAANWGHALDEMAHALNPSSRHLWQRERTMTMTEVTPAMLEAGRAIIQKLVDDSGYGWIVGKVPQEQADAALASIYQAMTTAHSAKIAPPNYDGIPGNIAGDYAQDAGE
jgi:hypothetical protein